MSNPAPNSQPKSDLLNDIGQAFLTHVDSRWIFVGVLVFTVVFALIFWLKHNRAMSRDAFLSLAQALLPLYSAPVLFCLLVLSDPPVFDPEKKFMYQSAAFLASLFQVAGLFKQIGKAWTEDEKNNNAGGHAAPNTQAPSNVAASPAPTAEVNSRTSARA